MATFRVPTLPATANRLIRRHVVESEALPPKRETLCTRPFSLRSSKSLATAVAMCSAGHHAFRDRTMGREKTTSPTLRGPGQDRGLDQFVLRRSPLAVFGTLHSLRPRNSSKTLCPRYMPGRMFWVYFVGCALIAASLSIAAKIGVRWSGPAGGNHDVYVCGNALSSQCVAPPPCPNYLDDRLP